MEDKKCSNCKITKYLNLKVIKKHVSMMMI